MSQSIDQIVKCLASHGWTPDDFRANHMEHVAHLHVGRSMLPLRVPFDRYWRTVAMISSLLQREGIFHVVIKTRRSYPYSDTNVDVFIKQEDAASAQQALCGEAWRMPSRPVRLKQRLIEREKIKLPTRHPHLVAAHLYMSVSWRYQREVTFLDEAMIEDIAVTTEAPDLGNEFGSLKIPVPMRAADLLLHCAEIVFENYRITLGEALYLHWLLKTVPEEDQRHVTSLGIDRGAGMAMRCILDRVRAAIPEDPTELALDWPRNLSPRELLTSWGERFRMQVRRAGVAPAAEEWAGYATFGTMYRVKRAWFD